MTSEQKFNRWLAEQFEGHFNRIENTTSVGMPDIYICREGVSIWVESKVFVNGRVLLRPAQHAWGFKHAANGGLAYVVALNEEIGGIFLWRHSVTVKPYSKYVEIISPPDRIWLRKDFRCHCHDLFTK